jgi:hypothetical protein
MYQQMIAMGALDAGCCGVAAQALGIAQARSVFLLYLTLFTFQVICLVMIVGGLDHG